MTTFLLIVVIAQLAWIATKFTRYLRYVVDEDEISKKVDPLFPVYNKAQIESSLRMVEAAGRSWLDAKDAYEAELAKHEKPFKPDEKLKELAINLFDAAFESDSARKQHNFKIQTNIDVLNGKKTVEEGHETTWELPFDWERTEKLNKQMNKWERSMQSNNGNHA